MLNSEGFNLWANGYDKSVNISEERNEYPFAGYKKVLGSIYNSIKTGGGIKILDIGFGTGVLSKKLYDEDCSIFGIDFSKKMIEMAEEKMPNAVLIHHDFTYGLPDLLCNEIFDFIICTYAIHHLTNPQKIVFINELMEHVKVGGKVLIGDVAFETVSELEQCKVQSKDNWDNDEIYPVVEIFGSKFHAVQFEKISFCSGVISFDK